jgi:hypothetical protein
MKGMCSFFDELVESLIRKEGNESLYGHQRHYKEIKIIRGTAGGAHDHIRMPVSGNSECCGAHLPPIKPLHFKMPVTGRVSLVSDTADLTIPDLRNCGEWWFHSTS